LAFGVLTTVPAAFLLFGRKTEAPGRLSVA
jgi:hypothetical protein